MPKTSPPSSNHAYWKPQIANGEGEDGLCTGGYACRQGGGHYRNITTSVDQTYHLPVRRRADTPRAETMWKAVENTGHCGYRSREWASRCSSKHQQMD